ncbi:hypothetical protein [Streptosporangium saharense]|uniref:Uncharacterized protein n=1 Tax=Streptosporangium saharense TaxID=1706840 RepID=A0A7W7VP08_9ACTN|nr:hypothetical protein [Streptosporangium saharense]MBB4917427.1 hypothetical protein [Streptosporangium saharense]
MSPEQLAKAKKASSDATYFGQLAEAAEGLGVTRVQREKAAAELEKAVGRRKAAAYRESALQRAGAPPKGLRRWIG